LQSSLCCCVGLGLGYIAVPAYKGSLAETRSLQPDQNKKEKSPISGLKLKHMSLNVHMGSMSSRAAPKALKNTSSHTKGVILVHKLFKPA